MKTIELDPDLWLYTRRTLGGGWRLAVTLTLWAAGLTLLVSGRLFVLPFLRIGAENSPRLLDLALFVLINAPVRPLAQLIDAERDGLLDLTRLCGRRPLRVLFAVLGGSIGPLLFVAVVLLANHLRFGGDVRSIYLAAIVFAGALGASLLTYGTLPASMTPDSRFLTPLLFIFGFVVFLGLGSVSWVQQLAFAEPAALITIGLVVVGLPIGVWLAGRRLARAPQSVPAAGSTESFDVASRLLPRQGPAELDRQLRRTLRSGGTLVTIVAAPFIIVAVERATQLDQRLDLYTLAMNAIPYTILLIGAFATSMTARQEVESAMVDFIRLTPQRPEAIAVSWYVALALPFWIAALVAVLTLNLAAPTVFIFRWPIVAIAAILPAFSLAEGLARRRPATYLWLPFILAMLGLAVLVFTTPRSFRAFASDLTLPWTAWTVDAPTAVSAMATVLAIGAAARLCHGDPPDDGRRAGRRPSSGPVRALTNLTNSSSIATMGSWQKS